MTALLVIATIVFFVGVDFIHVMTSRKHPAAYRLAGDVIHDPIWGPCMADGAGREDDDPVEKKEED